MKEIKKKIVPKYFKEVAEGKKDFEIRKDDSGYQVGDKLILQECIVKDTGHTISTKYTGDEITKRIKYKITSDEFSEGLKKGYCVLGLEDIEPKNKQQFQLGDTAYMIDDDYRFFESEVYKIELDNGEYYYTAGDCDFEGKDIGNWVFTSELYREIHIQNLAESEE